MDIIAAIMDSDSNFSGSVLVIDMVGSSELKETNSETAWLAIYGKAFDTIIRNLPGEADLAKFLGDGLMAVFPEDNATSAINCAIKIQEAMEKLRNVENFPCTFSIAVCTGHFKRIRVSDQKYDYLGGVVDRAFRLCSAANAKAIFVDKATTDAANVPKIKSVAGEALDPPRSKDSKYVGPASPIPLKGFKAAVEVQEILWRDSFGLKSSYPSSVGKQNIDPVAPSKNVAPAPDLSNNRSPQKPQALRGKFDRWINGDSGFIVGDNEERFFTTKSLCVNGGDFKKDDIVYFIPVADTGKSRKATGVVKIGEELTGRVVSRRPGDRFFFISSSELSPYQHGNIYSQITSDSEDFQIDDKVVFDLSESWNNTKKINTMSAINVGVE